LFFEAGERWQLSRMRAQIGRSAMRRGMSA
jgi:hypothetical protein